MKSNILIKNYFMVLVIFGFLFVSSLCFSTEEAEKPVLQRDFIVHLVKAMQIESQLPENPAINDYIKLIESKGITIPGGYKPDEIITTQQMAIMLASAMGLEKTKLEDIKKEIRDSYRDKATIVEVQGDVKYKLKDTEEWKEAKPGVVLAEEDTISTAKGAKLILRVGELSVLTIKEDTVFTLYNLAKAPALYVEKGELILDTHGSEKETPFHIVSPTTVTAVRGTILKTIVKEGITRVICYKGKVREYEYAPKYSKKDIINAIILAQLDVLIPPGEWVEMAQGNYYEKGKISPIPESEMQNISKETTESSSIVELVFLTDMSKKVLKR